MLREKGKVVAIAGDYVWVEMLRESSCQQCAVNKGCGTATLGKVLGKRYTRIKVYNRYNAALNDTVSLGIAETGLLKSALWTYAIPLLSMLVSMLFTASLLGEQGHEIWIILAAIVGLTAGLYWLRRRSQHLQNHPDYHPIMLAD